jgi:hypothetical protein
MRLRVNYLAMDESKFVVLNKEMDATISFWTANSGNREPCSLTEKEMVLI